MHHAMRATFAFAMTIAEHWHFSDFSMLLGIELCIKRIERGAHSL